ncbi:MAG: hypothetical protein RQ754_01170 [Desulfuromonadales bacterium]|nr:hypothetical protein [Desulfuromonadales bacterium]
MNLGEALQRYLKAETRGQLVIKFLDEEHLCKVAIEDGHALYITLGKKGPEETLAILSGKQVEWINFIDGMPSRKRLPHSLNKQLIEIALETRPATSSPGPKKASRTAGFDLTNGAPPETVEAIIEDFVDQIGPLGTVLADRVAQDLGYRAGALMEPGILDKFVAALADEIPVAERQAFLDKYGP